VKTNLRRTARTPQIDLGSIAELGHRSPSDPSGGTIFRNGL
jgi:hypothetical protein